MSKGVNLWHGLDVLRCDSASESPQTSQQLSHCQIRCGTRVAARRTSPMNTQCCETPCHQSHLLLSTLALTPRLERSRWRWRVCWPPTAVCTVRAAETTRHSLEARRPRRVRRPTKCTKRRQPLTVTTTEQLHQSTQVTTCCDTYVPPPAKHLWEK